MQHLSVRILALELIAASFVVLFQELALIRWLPAQVRVLAYYPNLVLISAFLGLGIGCLRAGRRCLLWLWPAAIAVLTTAAWWLSGVVFTQEMTSEHLFLLHYDLPRDAPVVSDLRPPLLLFFVLSAASFVPLGQLVADRLRRFGELSDSLAGYCWDITGSILGIVAFAALSFAGAVPVVWFTCLLAAAGFFFRGGSRQRASYVASGLAILFVIAFAERAEIYSPYYALRVSPVAASGGIEVLANGSLHQYAVGLERDRVMARPEELLIRTGYHLPYRSLAQAPRRALVIGAGTGNDVAVLLDEGAEQIDAVEIDPAILDIGRHLHPSRPYSSPKVRVFNEDARTFLNGTQEEYDLIVFGTLDSMTRLSALSSVRLDNFVYTIECLRSARSRLAPGGGLALYFMAGTDFIDQRLAGMVTRAFGEVPLISTVYYGLFNRIYMAGPAFEAIGGAERRRNAAPFLSAILSRTELPSDDWPYLYLRRRGVTRFYGQVAAALLLISVIGVVAASRDMRRSLRVGRPDWEMFLLGAGFLLLETGSVTQMNLVWGATWLTSAVVFLSVLVMILVAAATARWRPLPYRRALGLFAFSALLAYVAPAEWAMSSDWPTRLLASVLAVGVPIFFASMSFSVLFKSRPLPDRAFGWNVLGAVAGGVMEIGSMSIGLRGLVLVALAAYLGALWIDVRRRTAASPIAPA